MIDHNNDTPQDLVETEQLLPDAGIRAAERVRERHRAAKAARVLTGVFSAFMLLVLIAAGLFGWWAYNHISKGYTTVERQCAIRVGKEVIRGTRQYGYTYYDILGIQYRFNADVDEITKIQLESKPLIVIGYQESVMSPASTTPKWWAIPIPAGMRDTQRLKSAKSYTFILDNQVNVVDYEGFCKPTPLGQDGVDSIVQVEVGKR